MAKLAVLGLGAMGSRMAFSLLRQGHALTVWNRDPARMEPLIRAGADAAETPRAAVRDADFVIAMVRDDEASKQVWLDSDTGALAGMPPAAVAIDSSTLSVAWARDLAAHCRARDRDFLDAPVAGSRSRAETAELIFFVGGEPAVFEKAEPVLKAMGQLVHHAGPAGSGAAVKLMVNGLFGVQVAALGEMMGFIRRLGVDEDKALAMLASTPVCSPAAKAAGEAMVGGHFAPTFPIDLVQKDFAYILATAKAAETSVPLAEAAHAAFREALERGFGDLNVTGVARLYE